VASRLAKQYVDWFLQRRRESLEGQRPGSINVEYPTRIENCMCVLRGCLIHPDTQLSKPTFLL
jgi:hypothetical protein